MPIVIFLILVSSTSIQAISESNLYTTDNGTQFKLEVVIDKTTYDEKDITFVILIKIILESLFEAQDIHDVTLFCKVEGGTFIFEDTVQYFNRATDSLLSNGDSKAYSFTVDLSAVTQPTLSIYSKASFREDISFDVDPLITSPYFKAHNLSKVIKKSNNGFLSVNFVMMGLLSLTLIAKIRKYFIIS